MSLFFGVAAMMTWRWRQHLTRVRWIAVAVYFLLEMVMSRPAYYLISRIDLSGGSTGWHRARLIESTIEHFSEWWLFGTDYTRHWMASGVSWSAEHTDITNYYVQFGVWGGILSMGIILVLLWQTFRRVGDLVRMNIAGPTPYRYFTWSLGAGLFAQVLSGVSVSYFDQSMAFFWGNVAMISTLHSAVASTSLERQSELQQAPAWDETLGAASQTSL
jgi:hypothetical protein